jgi:hypothetical protein
MTQRELSQIIDLLKDPETGIKTRTKKKFFKTYTNCFAGNLERFNRTSIINNHPKEMK